MNTRGKVGRRSILGILGGLGVSNELKGLFRRSDSECDALAVQVMRMVNTAELRHKLAFGRYVDSAELARSPVLSRMRSDERLEKMKLGRSLLARMSLDRKEVVPGWELRMRLTSDPHGNAGAGYVAVISSRSEKVRTVFGSDQKGVIHEGTMESSRASELLPPSLDELAWDDVTPLGQHKRRKGFPTVLAAAFLALPDFPAYCSDVPLCWYCTQIGDPCGCACEGAYPICICCLGGTHSCHEDGDPLISSNCCNVGCSGCTWGCCS